jgi:hypothetical protein
MYIRMIHTCTGVLCDRAAILIESGKEEQV